MANVVVSAIATFNGKALKKGKKELSAFDKQAQQLGKTFSRVFAATALVAFSKKAINAFAADEQAAKSLAIQLENTGNAFRIDEVEDYIAKLQSLYGVLDDQLRPAFQTLLNATGSVTLSQQALETALNVSAGTGKDLASVVAAIAKGASGTTTALSRLGTGLDKATIASGDMNKIMAALDKKFSGQALARLETYAGKMDLLKVAAANATEIIGKGLVDALTILSEDNTIENLSKDMEDFATAIADTVRGIAILANKIEKLPGLNNLLTLEAIPVVGSYLQAFRTMGAQSRQNTQSKSNFTYGSGNPRADLILQKKLTTAKKEEYNILSASNKLKTEVDKLKDKFDLERIGLTAALNNTITAEDKLRVNALLAIANNNEALAKKYNAELEAALAAKELAKATGDLDKAFRDTIARLAIYDPIRNMAQGQGGPFISNVPSTPFIGTPFGQAGGNTGPINQAAQPIVLELAPNAGEFGQLIYNSFLINQKNGLTQTINGGLG
jgi:hypothetical protein